MNKFLANGRVAYWIAIAAASLTLVTHAVQAARSTNEIRTIAHKSQASKAQSRSFDLLLTAAYREGLYEGKLAAQRGEQRLAPVGRWTAQSDRDAFMMGYEQANPEIAEVTSTN